MSGTSMATPVVSGCLAVLLSQDSSLGSKQLKSQIINSCTSLNERSENQGAGVVNLSKLFKHNRKPVLTPNKSRPLPDNARPLPDNADSGERINQQDFISSGLIFMLFLILLLIRVI
ncbi:hypothetical protein Curi_c28420 [Gottschalkia acidurici 9a]|uniref:Peptidase S8/S53 domain-containing protein n=1 Tax=Gottschalkia acidurici (strain ATCC 7906 / DSM 604 / BCRC 14475 / CIP 104303 / KCTC 5404 / NCIMB 10678 / 9a) TaxID=1128398 RepID=K0B2Z1_GOTA9|nr:hypothetical protein Curi_c28420 [Gottschalkia acidurici 9a]